MFETEETITYSSSDSKKIVIEESNSGVVEYTYDPGMFLSFSFEPDLSHTSILYYCSTH